MTQRAEVLELRDGFERNEISVGEIWAYFNDGYISESEVHWILR